MNGQFESLKTMVIDTELLSQLENELKAKAASAAAKAPSKKEAPSKKKATSSSSSSSTKKETLGKKETFCYSIFHIFTYTRFTF